MNSIPEQKRDWRAQLKQRRAEMPEAARFAASATIRATLLRQPELRRARCVFCFISGPEEVDTRPLIDALVADSRLVVVPKILRGGPMIAVAFPGWDRLIPGPLGIPAPESPTEHDGPVDVCITPGLGFTPTGQRLGYGRGYYDRWFQTHPRTFRIAIGFECQLVPELPINDSDVTVHRVVTEARTIRIG